MGARNEKLDQGVQCDDDGAGRHTTAQGQLLYAEIPRDSFAEIAYQFHGAYHAPGPAEQHCGPYHPRPPDTPDQKRCKIALCIQLGINACRRIMPPGQYGQANKNQQRDTPEQIGKTAPEEKRPHRAETQQVDTFVWEINNRKHSF